MRREQDLALLPQSEIPPFTPSLGTSADLAIALLIHYSFDLSGYHASELVNRWRKQFTDSWLHLAVIEALYQGRYKAISVQQILTLWQRRGQAVFHFNMEFERLICSKFPESLTSASSVSQPQLPPINNTYTNHQVRKENNTQTGGHEDTRTQRHGEISPLTPYTPPTPPTPPTFPTPPPNPQRKLLPPVTNNSPIEQFTPQTSDRCELFTSKLKAMSIDQTANF